MQELRRTSKKYLKSDWKFHETCWSRKTYLISFVFCFEKENKGKSFSKLKDFILHFWRAFKQDFNLVVSVSFLSFYPPAKAETCLTFGISGMNRLEALLEKVMSWMERHKTLMVRFRRAKYFLFSKTSIGAFED